MREAGYLNLCINEMTKKGFFGCHMEMDSQLNDDPNTDAIGIGEIWDLESKTKSKQSIRMPTFMEYELNKRIK